MACSIAQQRPGVLVRIVLSTSGSCAAVGREGALLALGRFNADPFYPFTLKPVIMHPDGALMPIAAGARS
jgi:hypothetical protein